MNKPKGASSPCKNCGVPLERHDIDHKCKCSNFQLMNEQKPATDEEMVVLSILQPNINEGGSYDAIIQLGVRTLRAHVQREVKKALMERDIMHYKTLDELKAQTDKEKQQAVEKAMGELRERIVEGQNNFRAHNMNKDANTLEVVLTEIDVRYPNIAKKKENKR